MFMFMLAKPVDKPVTEHETLLDPHNIQHIMFDCSWFSFYSDCLCVFSILRLRSTLLWNQTQKPVQPFSRSCFNSMYACIVCTLYITR